MAYHAGQPFSTLDQDNDKHQGNCASLHGGGWWYNNCDKANLNAMYGLGLGWAGIAWTTWKDAYSFEAGQIMIRPVRHSAG